MRNKFFWIILSVISLVVVGTTLLHGEFLRREKIELIDQQVRESATALLDSELGGLRQVEFERVESILSEELGENRIGKFFVIRNNSGDVLFESKGVKLLPLAELPRSPRWITIHQNGKYIRLLNLELPKIEDRTLQIGLIIGEELLSPGYFSQANLFFTAAIMAAGLLLAWLLTAILMRPISKLSRFVRLAAHDPGIKMELPTLPTDLRKVARVGKKRDELADLLFGLENLINRVNRDYRTSRTWSYQMAHELKTPMALIEAKVNQGQREGIIPEPLAHDILTEVFETSETITSFLTWAELENSPDQKRLFVLPISKLLQNLQQRLSPMHNGRLNIRLDHDFNVMANVQHVEQALGNLILNALNHSVSERAVDVVTLDNSIMIEDRGIGIPSQVMERIGEPFNKGPVSNKGNGLGLALVHSICRLYDWKLNIRSGKNGTSVHIRFPPSPEYAVD